MTDGTPLATMDTASSGSTLAEKIAFLSQPSVYPHAVDQVEAKETHMSWVFLASDRAYKLKKPVRFSYLDFSTIERRAAACRAELGLNRRLAPDVYLEVVPLTIDRGRLAIGGTGEPTDWLVVMRRLDPACMLDQRLFNRRILPADVDRVAETLVHFYRGVRQVFPNPATYLLRWRRAVALNRRILMDRRLGLPEGAVRIVDSAQCDFLRRFSPLLTARIRGGYIRDGHGDLRPEHVWIGERVSIIDALEFSSELRAIDSLEEIAALSVECDALDAGWVGRRIQQRLQSTVERGAPLALYRFYRCYRASLRARLSIAHLLDESPRTPERWRPQANVFLHIAKHEAQCLELEFRRQKDR